MNKLALMALLAAVAYAKPVSAEPPAVVAHETGCIFYIPGAGLFADTSAKATAVQKPGWVFFTCHGTLPAGAPLPETAQTYEGTTHGAPCGTSLGPTLYWREVISPSGAVTVTCKYPRVPNG